MRSALYFKNSLMSFISTSNVFLYDCSYLISNTDPISNLIHFIAVVNKNKYFMLHNFNGNPDLFIFRFPI